MPIKQCYFVHMDRYMFKEKNNKLTHKLLLYIIIYYLMSYSVGINNLLETNKNNWTTITKDI